MVLNTVNRPGISE